VGRYGEFLLRSTGRGAEAYLDTFADGVFDEVSDLLDGVPRVSALDANDRGSLVQAVFGVALLVGLGGVGAGSRHARTSS